MVPKGDVIENPITGERIRFLKTAHDTNGKLLQLELFVGPRGFVAAEHVHPRQEERFQVLSGTLRFRRKGQEQDVSAGGEIVIPMNTPHAWWNAGDEEARVLVEFSPARNTQRFFETFFGLARDGKTNKKGLPHPLHIPILAREYDMYLPRPPIPVQKALFALLAPIGRLLGYKPYYPKYRSLRD